MVELSFVGKMYKNQNLMLLLAAMVSAVEAAATEGLLTNGSYNVAQSEPGVELAHQKSEKFKHFGVLPLGKLTSRHSALLAVLTLTVTAALAVLVVKCFVASNQGSSSDSPTRRLSDVGSLASSCSVSRR